MNNRYKILELLATGGMAHIYKATLLAEGFTKPIVIKKILKHYEKDPRWVDSFLNEAKIMSLLTHSHIVQVYDFGKSRSGYFLAMEYVEGGSLLELIQKTEQKAEKVPEPWVLYIGLEMLKGLSYAHKKGVLHRDISPANILISKEGEVKLTDFGVAKLQSKSLEPTQFLKGKHSYMSPEQQRKEALTYASDVYSLSCVLYELLTGEVYEPSCTLDLYPYLKQGLAENVHKRVQTCEEFEKILLEVVKQKQVFVTQREFAQFLQGYGPWRSQKTLILEDESVLSIPQDTLSISPARKSRSLSDSLSSGTSPSGTVPARPARRSFRIDKTLSSLSIWVLLFMCIFFGMKPPAFYSKGYLTLNAKPWGEVYVEKTYVGVTPLVRASLPTGKYQITVLNPFLKQTRKVAIHIEEDQVSKNSIEF